MSAGIGALVAQGAFWGITLYGWAAAELSARQAALFVLLWLVGLIGSGFVREGSLWFSSFVAVLDIVLAFLVFKGDIRLT